MPLPLARPSQLQHAVRAAPVTCPRRGHLALLTLFSLTPLCAPAAEPSPSATQSAAGVDQIRLPAGFHITSYAGDDLVHNAYSLTTDPAGRLLVSGPGYIKTLVDDDADGRADRALLFSDLPRSGAQGLCADGSRILFSGDGIVGALTDADADGHADGPPQVWAQLASQEHGAHAIIAGPDGDYYVVAGNEAGIRADPAYADTSPVCEPQCGAVLRFSRDGQRREILAHGFRNSYDLTFDNQARLFTVDSDGERAHHLPWYIPTRLFDVGIGLHHGWLQRGWQRSWNRPPWFPDVVPHVAEFGRGSPTGLVSYRHHHFPPPYQHGLFTACWTMGRVYHVQFTPQQSSVVAQLTTFLESTGASGFAPVDLEVGPQGELFVAVGGRGTRGGIYRIHYAGDPLTSHPNPQPPASILPVTDLDRLLRAPQPLAAWSRQNWEPLARTLGHDAILSAAADSERPSEDRLRAVEILTAIFVGFTPQAAETLLPSAPESLAARAVWSCGRWACRAARGSAERQAACEFLARMTHAQQTLVQRAAWEALAHVHGDRGATSPTPAWELALDSTDSRIRALALQVAQQCRRRGDPATWQEFASLTGARARLAVARLQLTPLEGAELAAPQLLAAWDTALQTFSTESAVELSLEALRILQLVLGDVAAVTETDVPLAGYVAREPECMPADRRLAAADLLANAFPSIDARLDRELARTLAMLDVTCPVALKHIAQAWTEHSSPVDDVHYLMVAARLSGTRSPEVRARVANAILQLDAKLSAAGHVPSRTWPDEVAAVFVQLLHHDPLLGDTILEHPEFGREGHCFLVPHLSEPQRRLAAHRCLDRLSATHDAPTPWSSDLVAVLRLLDPAELRPALRDQWDLHGYSPGLARLLARAAEPQDHARIRAALELAPPTELAPLVRALLALNLPASPDDGHTAVIALRRLAQSIDDLPEPVARDPAARDRWLAPQLETAALLVQQLARCGAPTLAPPTTADDLAALANVARDWLRSAHPALAQGLERRLGVDLPAWRARWATVHWDSGSADRGRDWFQRQQCARCHAGSSRLGPDLRGAATRLTRDDLFTAIVDPHQQIAPNYRTTLVLTRTGQMHEGLLIYESPEGTLLQTSAGETIRILADEFLSLGEGRLSLMPTGLLDALDDQALADLYAYLRTLTP